MSIEERRNKCIEFVLIELGLFFGGVIMYGTLGAFQGDALIGGAFGGYFLAALFCGGYYAVGLMKKLPLPLRVIAAFFIIVVMLFAMAFGMIAVIPMLVINIVNYTRLGKQLKAEADLIFQEAGNGGDVPEKEPAVKKDRSVLATVIVLLICAVVSVTAVTLVGNTQKELAQQIEYEVGGYTVTAVPAVVGERRCYDFKETSDVTGVRETYTYYGEADAESVLSDVEAYANYLIENESFMIGKNENRRIELYKYVGENDRLTVTIGFYEQTYTIEVSFTDR